MRDDVYQEVTKCGNCGQPFNGGPVCTFLPRLMALADDLTIPAVEKFHCGTCCPGHKHEPRQLPERSEMVETAYRRAQEAAARYENEGR